MLYELMSEQHRVQSGGSNQALRMEVLQLEVSCVLRGHKFGIRSILEAEAANHPICLGEAGKYSNLCSVLASSFNTDTMHAISPTRNVLRRTMYFHKILPSAPRVHTFITYEVAPNVTRTAWYGLR